MQGSAFAFCKLHEILGGPFLRPVGFPLNNSSAFQCIGQCREFASVFCPRAQAVNRAVEQFHPSGMPLVLDWPLDLFLLITTL